MAATRALLFGLCFVFLSRSYAGPTLRILGGENAALDEYPFVASVRLDNAHLCGGSIISYRHILTAGHCVIEQDRIEPVDVSRLSARVGSSNQFAGGKIVYIAKVTIHPDYTDIKNDLAILTLEAELTWTEKIQSISYARTSAELPPVDAVLQTAGWGETTNGASPYKMQDTKLTVASEDACTDAFKDNDESVICLAHKLKYGSCRGDAGNGAVYESKLIGVSNFVVGACGSRYPEVFANVAYYAAWIDSVLKTN